jgi:hypothetical protein
VAQLKLVRATLLALFLFLSDPQSESVSGVNAVANVSARRLTWSI